MPFYPLSCPQCGLNEDYILPVNNPEPVPCEECGFTLVRRDHQNYQAKNIQIQGETVSGGCSYAGFDVGLGCHITGKQHRAEVMEKQGKVPFVLDHATANQFDTIRNIKKHSQPGDPEAAKAIGKEHKEADYKRRRQGVEHAFKDVTFDKTMNAGS